MGADTSTVVARIGLDDRGFQDGVAKIQRGLKLVQSEFAAASSKLGDFGKSTDGLKLKADTLNRQIEIQKDKVEALNRSFQESVEKKGADAKATENLKIKLNYAVSELSNMQRELQATTTELNTKSSAWYKLSENMDKAGEKMKAVGDKMSSAGTKLSAAVTLPLVGVGVAATKMAMDAVESENLFEVAMGDMAGDARKWSEETSKALGLNAYNVRKNVSTYNSMLTSMGLTGEESLKMSEGLTQLSYDMASFYNLKPEEAFEKLKSGISGEAEPLKALGILVNDNTIKTYAYANGIAAQGEALTESQKVQARYGAILEATKNAQGDLARTMDSPTNKIRIMKEQAQEIGIQFGQILIPILENLMEVIKPLMDKFQGLSKEQQESIVKIGLIVAAVGPIILVIGKVITIIGAIASAISTVSGVISAAGGVTAAFGTVMTVLTGPIGIIIAVIAGLIAVGVALYKNWDVVKASMIAIWEGLKTSIGSAVTATKTAVVSTWESIKAVVIPIVEGIANVIKGIWEGVKTTFAFIWEVIKSIFISVLTIISSIVQTAINIVAAVITTTWLIISTITTTVWNGITNFISAVWNGIMNTTKFIWNAISSFFTNMWSGVTTLFTSTVNGIKSVVTNVWDNILGITTSVWGGIKSAIMSPIGAAVNFVKEQIDKIKDFFSGLNIKLPHIKLPHFNIKGEFSLSPPKVPYLDVSWYAKGGIFNGPSVIGVGEAGQEAVLPIDRLDELMARAIEKVGGGTNKRNKTGGITLHIENFINNTEKDIEQLAYEFEFYRQRVSMGRGGV